MTIMTLIYMCRQTRVCACEEQPMVETTRHIRQQRLTYNCSVKPFIRTYDSKPGPKIFLLRYFQRPRGQWSIT